MNGGEMEDPTPSRALPEAPDAAAGTELFRSPHLAVRQVGRSRPEVCVVTFNCLLDVPDIDAPGFGEAFFRSHGIDAIHVRCSGNDWYQYEEWPAALLAIGAVTRAYRRVVAYGSSMGAYAAWRYGGAVGAEEALAISPQFSIDGAKVPFEPRWRREASRLRFAQEARSAPVARATVIYDPCHIDRRHVDLIAEAVPLHRIRLPHAGHPAGAYLAEAGLLSRLVLGCCGAGLEADFERLARHARRRSGQYFLTLARKLPPRRGATKRALAEAAASASPEEPVYHSYLALLRDAGGDPAGAEASHRRALALGPAIPLVLTRFARFLIRQGRVAEAAPLVQAVAALKPHDPKVLLLGATVLLLEGRGGDAIRRLRGGPAWSWAVLAVDAARLAAWRPTGGGWRLRGLGLRADRIALHLGVADECASADIAAEVGHGRPSGAASPRPGGL